MLTQNEKDFLAYWEKNREWHGKVVNQFLMGLPLGLLFSLPILLILLSGFFKNLPYIRPSLMVVIIIAVLIISGFMGIMYRKQKWEKYEQKYKDIKRKLNEPENHS